MQTLFPLSPGWPEGFSYQPDFITKEEENQLLALVKQTDVHVFTFQGYEAKRRVASFGFDWSFEQQQLKKGKDIPEHFHWLMHRVADYVSLAVADFAELLVTEYPAGSVINWHRDAPPFELIAGISLQTDGTFKLRPYDKAKQNRRSTITLPIQKRSLYIMSGPSRWEWQHSIIPVKDIRYSITLRTLKK